MSYKSILVQLTPTQDTASALEAGLRIAAAHGASLTGLYTRREIALLKIVFGADNLSVIDAEARERPLMEKAEAEFRAACLAGGVRATWDVGEGNASELLSLAGRCHDLIIVQQSVTGLDGFGSDIAEECAVVSGVPTLIVPKKGLPASTGQRVVVAWNHSRQSAAAVQGAMPFIEKAEQVVVLLGPKRDLTPSVTRAPRADIEAHLRRHAANVDVVTLETGDADAGMKLLVAAHGARADLLVMGAYGRSAWREFLFGGATSHVIANLDLPVLMAH
jgi:nucleotide-binding universal stress UspA family protein